MGARIRGFDWGATPLGPPARWPTALKTLVALMLASRQPMFIAWGPEQIWLCNDAFIPILGGKHPFALGCPAMEVWAEARAFLEPLFDQVFAGEPVSIEDFTLELDRRGRLEEAHFEFAYTPARDEDGEVRGLFGACIETTGRVLAERRQAAAIQQQRRQFQAAPGFIAILTGPDHVIEFANDAYVALIGHRDIVGKALRDALPELAGQGFSELLDKVFQTGERYVAQQAAVRLARQAGEALEERFVDFVYAPILGDADAVTGVFVEGFDVTGTHMAQEALRTLNETLEHRVRDRTRDLEAAQQALAQAQKIEAIGQLTGGVAHDFNNLLMVILGGLSMIDRPGDPARRARIMDGMRHAAERGASLSRQLLAFSRRQPLKAAPVNLATQLASMGELLDRTLRGDVHVQIDLSDDLWPVLVDPAEFELVMLNLCVNARDAMPSGGAITIAAANAADETMGETAGDFVRLSVRDDGVGMSEPVLERIFEPFFTTKGIGKGSGLGLPQVYGFVQQSGGAIRVESREGDGTTVTLWLPRSAVAAEATRPAIDLHIKARSRSSGVILLVEDDAEVARLVTDMLGELGFEVVHAASAQAALGGLANNRKLDLMFSDIMMPGEMNGLDLVREARTRRAGLPVLLTSGYAESAITEARDEGIVVLPKPYDIRALADAIARVLPGDGSDEEAELPFPT